MTEQVFHSHEWGDNVYDLMIYTLTSQPRKADKVAPREDGKYVIEFKINGVSFDFKKAAEHVWNRCLENSEYRAAELIEDRAQKQMLAIQEMSEKVVEEIRRFSAKTFPKSANNRCRTCGYYRDD